MQLWRVTYVIPFSGNTADVDDYTASGDTVILSADMPEVTIEIPIIDDSKPEGDEQFVIIGNFGGASGPSMRTITIKDDDPGVIKLRVDKEETFESSFVNEGRAYIPIDTIPPLADTFTLNYVIEFAGGTATADDVQSPMTGEVELGTALITHDLYLDLVDDTDPEGPENFFVPSGSQGGHHPARWVFAYRRHNGGYDCGRQRCNAGRLSELQERWRGGCSRWNCGSHCRVFRSVTRRYGNSAL